MLAVLHMAQYFPAAFAGTALPFLFRKEGLPLEMFWLLALPRHPTLVPEVGPGPGRRPLSAAARVGRRKSWIIPCTAIGALCLRAASPCLTPSLAASIYPIVAILLFAGFVMAAQDIAVDAYAAESMTDAERPRGTALINFLAAVASVLGIVAVSLVELFGWQLTMLAAASLLLVAALPAILRPEPPPPLAQQEREARGEAPSLLAAVKRKDSHQILPFMFVYGFGQHFFLSMLGPFWADQNLSIADFGMLAAVTAIAGGAVAAVATPRLIDRFGMRFTATLGLAVLPLEAIAYCVFTTMEDLPPLAFLMVVGSLLSFSTSLYAYTVSISRFRWVSKSQAGTDYSMQSSLWNLGIWAAGSTSGLVAGYFGYLVFFPIAAAVTLIGGVYYVWRWQHVEDLVLTREAEEISGRDPTPTA